MTVYCFASHWDGNALHLMNSLRHAGVKYEVRLDNRKRWGWDRMVEFELKMAERHPEELMIFIDLWDSIFVGEAEEMWQDIERLTLDRPMLHTDKNCWPQPEKAGECDALSRTDSPWRYVNGSGPFGRGRDIARVIREGMKRYPIHPLTPGIHPHTFPQNDNDQRFWTDLYLDGLVGLDHRCEIVQGLPSLAPGELEYREGRIHNLVTDSRPHFLHAADHTWAYIPQEVINDKSLRPRK